VDREREDERADQKGGVTSMDQFSDDCIRKIAAIVRTSARLAASCDEGWGVLLRISIRNQLSKGKECLQIWSAPRRVHVIEELVEAHLLVDDDVALGGVIGEPLRAELGPFIEGVGQIVMKETPEGFILSRKNPDGVDLIHDSLLSDATVAAS
jgi:hypothetical protein